MISLSAQAFAASEFQRRELIHKYVSYPMEDWDKLTKVNNSMVDEELLAMVKANMRQLIKEGFQNPQDANAVYKAQASFIYAYLADYLGKKLRKKEENRFFLARIYDNIGRLDKAADICNNIVLTEPKNINVMLYLADLFERMKMSLQAFDTYQKILKLDKNNKIALFQLGELYVKLAQYKKAVDLFKRVLKVDPDNRLARRFVDLYEGKLQTDPKVNPEKEQAVNHFFLGEQLFNQGKFEASASEYSRAVELDPTFAKAYVFLGVCLSRQKKYKDAMDVFNMAVKLDEKDPEAYYFMGETMEKQFTFDPSLTLIDQAIAFYKTSLSRQSDYYFAQDGLNRAEEARKNFMEKQGAAPQNEK